MPYDSIRDLPTNVRQPLPKAAQAIWMRAFNKGWDEATDDGKRGSERDTQARQWAWQAVKAASYVKDEETGKWVMGEEEDKGVQAAAERSYEGHCGLPGVHGGSRPKSECGLGGSPLENEGSKPASEDGFSEDEKASPLFGAKVGTYTDLPSHTTLKSIAKLKNPPRYTVEVGPLLKDKDGKAFREYSYKATGQGKDKFSTGSGVFQLATGQEFREFDLKTNTLLFPVRRTDAVSALLVQMGADPWSPLVKGVWKGSATKRALYFSPKAGERSYEGHCGLPDVHGGSRPKEECGLEAAEPESGERPSEAVSVVSERIGSGISEETKKVLVEKLGGLPEEHIEGIKSFTGDAPFGYETHAEKGYYHPRGRPKQRIYGGYNTRTKVIHVSPFDQRFIAEGDVSVILHEIGHHVAYKHESWFGKALAASKLKRYENPNASFEGGRGGYEILCEDYGLRRASFDSAGEFAADAYAAWVEGTEQQRENLDRVFRAPGSTHTLREIFGNPKRSKPHG